MSVPSKSSSSDRVTTIVSALRGAIIEQAIGPGTRLPEDSIGDRFGASRTIVRAALGELAAEGLVEMRRNRSAVVAEPSWNDAKDTFDIRVAVEELVVRRLAGALTPDQVVKLGVCILDKPTSNLLDSY